MNKIMTLRIIVKIIVVLKIWGFLIKGNSQIYLSKKYPTNIIERIQIIIPPRMKIPKRLKKCFSQV
jgi:hypothetical protein